MIIARTVQVDAAIFDMELPDCVTNTANTAGFIGFLRQGPGLL